MRTGRVIEFSPRHTRESDAWMPRRRKFYECLQSFTYHSNHNSITSWIQLQFLLSLPTPTLDFLSHSPSLKERWSILYVNWVVEGNEIWDSSPISFLHFSAFSNFLFHPPLTPVTEMLKAKRHKRQTLMQTLSTFTISRVLQMATICEHRQTAILLRCLFETDFSYLLDEDAHTRGWSSFKVPPGGHHTNNSRKFADTSSPN